MGERIGSRVFIGMVLAVVAGLGITQLGVGADPASGLPQEPYPTVCPKPLSDGAGSDALLPQDPCEPYDPCSYDSDGDGLFDCEDPCPTDAGNTCDDPPPTTQPPTTQPPTTQPPTTQPPTTAPPTAQPPTTVPTPTAVPVPTIPGCQQSCAYPRTVGLRVKGAKLRGTIDSSASGCRTGATVTVWQKKKGADRPVVVLASKQNGAFAAKRPTKAGAYYVTVASPEQPLCGSARSRAIRIKG